MIEVVGFILSLFSYLWGLVYRRGWQKVGKQLVEDLLLIPSVNRAPEVIEGAYIEIYK